PTPKLDTISSLGPRHEFGADLFRGIGDRDRAHAIGHACKKSIAVLGRIQRVYVEHRRESLDKDRLLRPDQYEIGLAARHVVLRDQMKPQHEFEKLQTFRTGSCPK